jgi:hypothetical protein
MEDGFDDPVVAPVELSVQLGCVVESAVVGDDGTGSGPSGRDQSRSRVV